MYFLDGVQYYCLYQQVESPSRAGNIIDLVSISKHTLTENVKVVKSFGTSDHNAIVCSAVVEVDWNKSILVVPDFHKANFRAMRRHLHYVNWESILW